MFNQKLSPKNRVERFVSIMTNNKTIVVKVIDVKKAANVDLTQTKEFWSNLAVIS
ncbi:hypothetical protein [Desulfosporosinus sp. Sb-LF]|uniref:hypothetical protein n=1 Tax=Desulfosporosinus sp. Sb-LF TaxID=2560027 RepID=UPI0018EE8BDD|nr:hypothetical protein [Desulfosporosinus sp. Sb-LF]